VTEPLTAHGCVSVCATPVTAALPAVRSFAMAERASRMLVVEAGLPAPMTAAAPPALEKFASPPLAPVTSAPAVAVLSMVTVVVGPV